LEKYNIVLVLEAPSDS